MNENLSLLLGLGPNAEWPYTEKSIIELIQLQREKEVTKQLYYKLETLNKSVDLLNYCKNANIPSFLIPIVFSGETLTDDLINNLVKAQSEQVQQLESSIPVQPQSQQQQRSFQSQPQPQSQHASPHIGNRTPGRQSTDRPLYANYRQQQPIPQPPFSQQQQQQQRPPQPSYDKPSTNLGPPVSFHRPLSPAKIGAAAVAQLDRGRYPSSPVSMHRRNQSLPAPAYIPHNSNNNSTPTLQVTSPSLKPVKQPQQSMMGTLSSIQFISENPGRKRRRSSLDVTTKDHDADLTENTEDEDAKEKDEIPIRRKGHVRTKSANVLLDKEERELIVSEINRPLNPDEKTKRSGPNFANNILSTA